MASSRRSLLRCFSILLLVPPTQCFITNLPSYSKTDLVCLKLAQQPEKERMDEEVSQKDAERDTKQSEKKPPSRLAMAAADWMEEEEDELAMYWERFDASKRGDTPITSAVEDDADAFNSSLTTEELLDRYHLSRGIDRRLEREKESEILNALQKAREEALTAEDAIQILTPVRPYLQTNTRLGGEALIELARAYWEDSQEIMAKEICTQLLSSPHRDVKRGAREVMTRGSDQWSSNGKDMWKRFLDPTSWWT